MQFGDLVRTALPLSPCIHVRSMRERSAPIKFAFFKTQPHIAALHQHPKLGIAAVHNLGRAYSKEQIRQKPRITSQRLISTLPAFTYLPMIHQTIILYSTLPCFTLLYSIPSHLIENSLHNIQSHSPNNPLTNHTILVPYKTSNQITRSTPTSTFTSFFLHSTTAIPLKTDEPFPSLLVRSNLI